MDAGCGLSTRGHWYGPVICNEAGQAVPASVAPHGERSHVNTQKHHVGGTLLLALNDRRENLVGSSSSPAVVVVVCLV